MTQVIKSLEKAEGIENWEVLFCAQDPAKEVLDVIDNSNFFNSQKQIRELKNRDFSIKKSINSNLYFGLEEIFVNRQREFAIVLEDDVLVLPEFLNYMFHFLEQRKDDPWFRGVNSVSSYVGKSEEKNYGEFSQGFMWGWGTTKKQYLKMKKFWTGSEDAHWDYFLEPYLRSGYVINPLHSLVINIGFDESASHTKSAPSLEKSIVDSSKESNVHTLKNWKETKIDFRMRSDYLPLSKYTKKERYLVYIVMKTSFLIYFWGIKLHRLSHFISRRIRNSFLENR